MSAGLFASTLLDDPMPAPLYWHEARRPLPTLLFVLPLVAAYEFGVTCLGAAPDVLRNGADSWMRSWMLSLGLPWGWVLPVLLVAGLFTWQMLGRYPWRVSFDTLTGMFGESLLFALLLIVVGQSLNVLFRSHGFETLDVEGSGAHSPAARALSFLGAGIYEETMFRLALIPLTFYLLRMLLVPRTISLVLAVVTSSLVFASAHYLDPSCPLSFAAFGDAFHRVAADEALWYGFAFRLLAGLTFSLLLLLRGFGITVGSHALYDVLAGVLMQAPTS
jgi:hypothetical protein